MTHHTLSTTLTVTPDDWTNAVQFLEDHLDLSKSKIKSVMNKGGVWLSRSDGVERLRRATTELRTGDEVTINYDPERLDRHIKEIDVLADEVQYSAWIKPAGMPITGDKWADFHCFERNVELACHSERPVLPMLDMDEFTAGVMLVAHQPRMASQLTEQFSNGEATVRFRTEVRGDVSDTADNLAQVLAKNMGCEVTCETQSYNDYGNTSKVDITLTHFNKYVEHTLRQALADADHPVMGDEQYGEDNDSKGGIRLRLFEMSLRCPVNFLRIELSLYN